MLTVRDHTILRLAFDQSLHRRGRVSLLELTGLTEPRFWQVAGALLDRPDAVAVYPVEVGRLRRLREARRVARSG